ncbi:MAG: alpha/beta hydrolase [Rhodoferax sp.]|nr:alpha/beta hydrolase [Rhodoferax sp.]
MDWGAPDAPLVIAWHGLARTGRDMDALAAALSDRYRVICPDTLGRGLSQWSRDPDHDYCLRFYARQARELLDHLGAQQVHWLGTSMGGAIGTAAASGLYEPALRARIQSLVLNDNAPELAATAIERIRTYAGSPPAFDSVTALEAFFRQVYQPFGWMSDDEWRKLAETSTRRLPDGRVTPHYDPAMVRQFIVHPDDYRLWDHYDALDLPVLCLHGVESDLVRADTLAAMRTRGPGARGQLQVLDVPGVGHAPALNVPDQIQPIRQFLDAAQAQR